MDNIANKIMEDPYEELGARGVKSSEIEDMIDNEELGIDDEMNPGAGYWISMDAQGNYRPETVCEDLSWGMCMLEGVVYN